MEQDPSFFRHFCCSYTHNLKKSYYRKHKRQASIYSKSLTTMKVSLPSFLLATAVLASSAIVATHADCHQQKDLEEVSGFQQQVRCGCSDDDDQLTGIQYDGAMSRNNWCTPKGRACTSTDGCCGTWECKNAKCMATATSSSTAKGASKMGHVPGVDHGNDGGGHNRLGGNGGHRRKLRGV